MKLSMNLGNWLCYVVGYVFITSAIMKLLVSSNFVATFYNLGVPFPATTVFLVAITEFICGVLIVGGMYVKKATIPLLVIMVVAIYLTKLPVLFDEGLLAFAFQSRLDFVILILLLLLNQHVRGKKF
ncbi:DoxX family protein [Ornithinibacillus contaminans]|uniref:DoxX family protein n=1 Tax=Ornithinibacillus contaminans TaxID=694055 RepID=UPI001F250CB3|nr:DoxX family protein [Ornithinibacillus contaminans]